MKIRRKIIAGIFSIFSMLQCTHAASNFDGIWVNIFGSQIQYFSITVTNGTILAVDLEEVARYQSADRAAYVGTMPIINGTTNFAPFPFTINVYGTPLPSGTVLGWVIKFESENNGTLQRPPALNISPIPPTPLKKIF